jgi:large subunit ribosomal protein L10
MNLQQKQQAVEQLAEKLGTASAFYLTDFVGLTVKRMTDLRARLRREGGEYLVVKNTLAERALEGLDVPGIAEFFRGPTGLVIAPGDPVAPIKALADFARENDNRPVIKAGVVERRALAAADVERLARLPGREQLLAELAGALQAPLSEFVFVLQAKLQETAGLLDALREQRGDDGGSASAAAV